MRLLHSILGFVRSFVRMVPGVVKTYVEGRQAEYLALEATHAAPLAVSTRHTSIRGSASPIQPVALVVVGSAPRGIAANN